MRERDEVERGGEEVRGEGRWRGGGELRGEGGSAKQERKEHEKPLLRHFQRDKRALSICI